MKAVSAFFAGCFLIALIWCGARYPEARESLSILLAFGAVSWVSALLGD